MASVIEKTVLQLQTILKLFFCNRRQQKPTINGYNKVMKPMLKKQRQQGADLADASTDYISDQSGLQSSTGSESETDACFQGTRTSSHQQAAVRPPPGLGKEPEQKRKEHPWSRTHTTADLVESQLRARKAATSFHNTKAAQIAPGNLAALQDALQKLDANEIETVKSLLDFKMRDASQPFAVLDPPAARRPFVPFQGAPKAPHESFRPRERKEPPRLDQEERARRQTQIDELEQSGETLRTHLRDLSLVENGRVLTLRKISKLGLNSPEILEDYFTKKFGKVDRMMVTHTIGKLQKNKQEKVRLRPAPLGFILMNTVEAAQAALNSKEAHIVNGVEISVLPFNSHPVDDEVDQ